VIAPRHSDNEQASANRDRAVTPRRALFAPARWFIFQARSHPAAALVALLAAVLSYLVAVPVAATLLRGFQVQYLDQAQIGLPAGSWTLYYLHQTFASAFSNLNYWTPLLHSLTTACGAVLFASTCGTGIAFAIRHVQPTWQRWLHIGFILPFTIPSLAIAEAWSIAFKPLGSLGPKGILASVGIGVPHWLASGPIPIIAVLGIHYMPLVVLLVGGALDAIDPILEDAAAVAGASIWAVRSRITLRLLVPAIAAAALLVFAGGIGDFSAPFLLGLPDNYTTLSAEIYSNVQRDQMGLVAFLSITVVLAGAMALLWQGRMTRGGDRFVTISGTPTVKAPPRTNVLGASILTALALVIGIGPLFLLALSTVTSGVKPLALNNLTLCYWTGRKLPFSGASHGLLLSRDFAGALEGSLFLAGSVALLCGLLGFLIAYLSRRSGSRTLSSYLRNLSFAPHLIPGITLGVSFLVLFSVRRGPIPALYGTTLLLIIAMVVAHLPYASQTGYSTFAQLGREPEEAAQMTGAGPLSTLARVVGPLVGRGFAVACLFAFIQSLKEVNIVVMLTINPTALLPTLSLTYANEGYSQLADGASLVISAIAIAGTVVIGLLSGGGSRSRRKEANRAS